MTEPLAERLHAVAAEIDHAAACVGRSSDDVTLVVVTKSAPPEIFDELASLGVTDVGESRLQDAERRMAGHEQSFRWHFIGHLQGNKARRCVERFDVIHGVDSLSLLSRIDRVAGELGRAPEVLGQINVSGEANKHGFPPDELDALLAAAAELRHARFTGLMTMAPRVTDPEQVRSVFTGLADLARPHPKLGELSMGMSEDYAVAVQEGATLVRVGRRIVGAPPPPGELP